MAIYSYKESAIEDTIQTPDDVGVYLDQIEEDIAGKDGIEAHRDEIEYTEEEGVGDPLEECATLIYESTYNMNQILKCLKIHDLQEASRGRELVLEAVDVAGFCDKIYDALVAAWRKITEIFAKIRADFRAKNAFFEKWAKEHAELVHDGQANCEKKVKGYPALMDKDWVSIKLPDAKANIENDIKLFGEITAVGGSVISNEDTTEAMLKEVYSKMFGKSSESVKISDFESALKELYFGSSSMEKSDLNVDSTKVLAILNDKASVKLVESAYAEMKKTYNGLLDSVRAIKRAAVAHADDPAQAKAVKAIMANINKKISAVQNVASCSYKLAIQAIRTRKLTAFAVAKAYAACSKKAAKEEKKPEPKQESANLFDTISFA